jgi:hypothetical protein
MAEDKGCSEHWEQVDDVLEVLRHPIRREIVSYFEGANSPTTATIEELAARLDAEVEDHSSEELTVILYQIHLPKLQSYGWVSVDQEKHVRYHGDDGAEQVLQRLQNLFTG